MWFADLVGASVAAVAMAVACATIVFAQVATKGAATVCNFAALHAFRLRTLLSIRNAHL